MGSGPFTRAVISERWRSISTRQVKGSSRAINRLLSGFIGQVGVGSEIGLVGQVVDDLKPERFGIELGGLDPMALDAGERLPVVYARLDPLALDPGDHLPIVRGGRPRRWRLVKASLTLFT